MIDDEYTSLEKVSRQLRLPQSYIRQQTEAGKIPHLIVGGRLRYQVKAVREALARLSTTEKRRQTVLGTLLGSARAG
jgi:hypothetical protein